MQIEELSDKVAEMRILLDKIERTRNYELHQARNRLNLIAASQIVIIVVAFLFGCAL